MVRDRSILSLVPHFPEVCLVSAIRHWDRVSVFSPPAAHTGHGCGHLLSVFSFFTAPQDLSIFGFLP